MSNRDVDDMEDIIDDLIMRKRSGKHIAETLVKCGFGRKEIKRELSLSND